VPSSVWRGRNALHTALLHAARKPKQQLGKLREPVVAATSSSSTPGRLFVTDKKTGTKFLIDTGSDVCAFPRRLALFSYRKANYDLIAANGTAINTDSSTFAWTSGYVENSAGVS